LGAAVGGVISGSGAIGRNVIGKMKSYAPNKVRAIRAGAKVYHKEEVKAYGNMLKKLESDSGPINAEPALEKMEEIKKIRGIISPEGKELKPTNRVDRELVKAYDRLMAKWVNGGGKTTVGDVVKELQAIKNAGGNYAEPTQIGRLALDTQHEILGAIKPQINSETFLAGNARYVQFKQHMEALDKYFDVWGNPILTGKGERFLMRGSTRTGESKAITDLVTEKTGQTLKGAKTASKLDQFMRNPWTWRIPLAVGGGKYLSGRHSE